LNPTTSDLIAPGATHPAVNIATIKKTIPTFLSLLDILSS